MLGEQRPPNCIGRILLFDEKTQVHEITDQTGGCEPQLKGHIQTNINVGNDKQTMLSVVTQLLLYIGYPRTLNALRCINEIVPE